MRTFAKLVVSAFVVSWIVGFFLADIIHMLAPSKVDMVSLTTDFAIITGTIIILLLVVIEEAVTRIAEQVKSCSGKN